MNAANAKQRAALASVVASAALAVGKLTAGLLSGSLALTSDAGHAGLDTLSTLLTFFAVRAADKPADEEHHYGHAKIEAVAALAETGLLLFLSGVVLYEAIHRISDGVSETLENAPVAFAVLIVSIVVDFVRWRSLSRVAEATSSHALAADALHFSSDCLSSVLVLLGLVASKYGFHEGDAIAAVGVALFICLAGVRLGRRTIDTLIDAAPKGASQQVRTVVQSIPGVVAIDSLRLRPSGGQLLGDVEVAVPRTMPIESAEAVRAAVALALARAMPEAALTIAATPRALDTETVRERVLLAAARRRMAVHHVMVQDLEGRKSVSLDVEIDGRIPHAVAHEMASRLENELREELGGDIEVETHLEPLDLDERPGAEAEPKLLSQIESMLVAHAKMSGCVNQIHGVRVREGEKGLVVNYHCRVDGAMTVAAVHEAVDDLDRALREDFPQITRIIGHAEPL